MTFLKRLPLKSELPLKNQDECEKHESEHEKDRREFLIQCGKYAVYTTPLISTLLHYDKAKAIATVS